MNYIKPKIKVLYHALANKSVPLNRNEGLAPFFIVGSGRAGTTLLRRFLMGKNVHIPPEIWSMKKVINKFNRLSWFISWDSLIKMIVTSLLESADFKNDFRSKAHKIIDDLKNINKEKWSLAFVINHIYISHASWLGTNAKRWGDKTPLNSYALNEIDSVFPDANYIHLIRDGVDVVNSYLMNDLVPDLETGSNRWITAIQEVKKFKSKNPKKVLEVRYEELVTNPESITKQICHFLDIPFKKKMLQENSNKSIQDLRKHDHHKNVFKEVTNEHIGKGRRNFNKNECRKLGKMINDQLIDLGYKPI